MLCTSLLFMTLISFGQQTDPGQSLTRHDYLAKSKGQKTAAWVLLGGGAALIGTGLLIGNREESSFDDAATGGILAGVGVVSAIGSIPLFIASGRNKRKAMDVSTYIGIQQNSAFTLAGITRRSCPALSIKIKF